MESLLGPDGPLRRNSLESNPSTCLVWVSKEASSLRFLFNLSENMVYWPLLEGALRKPSRQSYHTVLKARRGQKAAQAIVR